MGPGETHSEDFSEVTFYMDNFYYPIRNLDPQDRIFAVVMFGIDEI